MKRSFATRCSRTRKERLEEARLFENEADPLVDIDDHGLDCGGDGTRYEGLGIAHPGAEAAWRDESGEVESDEGEAAAADRKPIVAAGDRIATETEPREVLGEAAVVGQARLGCVESAEEGLLGEGVLGELGVVAEGEVGHGPPRPALVPEDGAAHRTRLRAEIAVAEGVGKTPIDLLHEEGHDAFLLGEKLAALRHETAEEGVEVADPDRVARDRGYLTIEAEQGEGRAEEIPRRLDAEEGRSPLEKGVVVGDDVARPPGSAALAQVADHSRFA